MGIQVATVVNLDSSAAASAAKDKITETSMNTALQAVGLPTATLSTAPTVLSKAPRATHAWVPTFFLLGFTVFYSIDQKKM